MKTNMLLTILLAGMTLFLANCSKSNDSSTNTANSCQAGYVYTQAGCLPQNTAICGSANYGYSNGQCYAQITQTNSCTAGYVNTQMGCLPQGTCQVNQGYYNGQCFPAVNTGVGGIGGSCQAGYVGTQMGCLPQGTCTYYGPNYGYLNGYCYPRTY